MTDASISVTVTDSDGASASTSVTVSNTATSGSYNNLANFPSAVNRPALNGNLLTWTGPSLSGGTSTTNDVVGLTRALTSAGGFSTSSDNQVVQGLNITGNVYLSHDGVVLRQCAITGGEIFVQNPGTSGFVTIEDCIINGSTGSGHTQNGIGQTAHGGWETKNMVFRRNNIFNYENHLSSVFVGCTVIDNWFHRAQGPDADMCEFYAGCINNVLQHNSYDGQDTVSGAFLNSGVNFSTYPGGNVTGNKVIGNCFLKIGSAHDINDDNQWGSSLTWACTNNGFYASSGLRIGRSNSVSPNSGNYNMTTVSATSGVLINGGSGAV